MATHREVICSNDFTVSTDDIAGRHTGTVFRLGDDLLSQTGGLVSLSAEGDALDDIVELQGTGILRDNHGIERIPLGNLVASPHLVTMTVVE